MLEKALSFDQENKDYKLLMTAILLRRNRPKEAYLFLKSLLESEPINKLYNIIMSFLYTKYLKEVKLGEKYKRIAERIH